VSEPTADDWLLSLDEKRSRRLAVEERHLEETSKPKVPNAAKATVALP
jgi:hypothetical protein